MKKKHKKDSQHKQCDLFIEGMHCASCELLIEKKLLKMEGVESVDVSIKDSRARIVLDSNTKVDLDEINKLLKDYGYSASYEKPKKRDLPFLSLNSTGSVVVNKAKLGPVLNSLVIAICFLVIFFIVENLQLGRYVSVDASSSLPAFFLLGLVAGISSCAALIGGLLLSMTKQWHDIYIASDSDEQKAEPHILFHIGRLISFFVLGGVLALIGDKITLDNSVVYSALTLLVSGVMLLLALQMLNVSWAQKFKITAPASLTRFVASEDNFQGRYMPFALGFLTFFLPCGFTLIAQGIALVSGSFLSGALIMSMFALGTLPMLLSISYTGLKLNKKPHLTAKFNKIAGLIVLFFVIYNINGQMNVLGLSSLNDLNISSNSNQENTNGEVLEIDKDGVQRLRLVAKGFSYSPETPTIITSGVDTKLIVDNQGILGCGSYLAATGLISNFVPLNPGENIIDLGKPQKGEYKITCSMGMVPPVAIKVI